eukprot:TRINITY_DN112364_c0_g1_i1.p1 TRINITY_DN112364_c0_g1~~TRINITY_DN112364_c0_g1_i1.p1  ORF type:complete len:500 (-),score=81.63 TRINITY_DN112364_c0_g1_i1:127-1626(-)
MFRTLAAWSPKLKRNTHPRNVVNFKGGKKDFYKPKLGASKMKWNYTVPYRREVDSLYHYPEVSRLSGKVVNWYHNEPVDLYSGAQVYGEHTLELKGLPLGKTPEYMQERLRRFFSKFGPVMHCRALNHHLDPYQCEGTAYVTFRDRDTAMEALKAPLKFPASMHDKIISMRHLDTDKENDPDYLEKAKFWDCQLVSIARQLHSQLLSCKTMRAEGKAISVISNGLLEKEMLPVEPEPSAQHLAASCAVGEAQTVSPAPIAGRGGVPLSKGGLIVNAPTRNVAARHAILQRFGSWERFLAEPPFDELFMLERQQLSPDQPEQESSEESPDGAAETLGPVLVKPRLVSTRQRAKILERARLALRQRLHEEFSVFWRQGKIPLPEYTQRRVEWWKHAPVLPNQLQIMSRPHERMHIFSEKYLYKQQLKKARNERRAEHKAEIRDQREKSSAEKKKALDDRREKMLSNIGAENSRVLGLGLVPKAHYKFDPVTGKRLSANFTS